MVPPPSSAEWSASLYHQISDPQFRWGQAVLARLPLHGHETVLDAGCGTGRLTALLLERLPHGRVVALDRSVAMLSEAQQHLAPYGDRVSFVQADLQTYVHATPIDAIFSTATFHWVTDHPQLFRNLHTMLNPGGHLIAQCGGGPNLARFLGDTQHVMASAEFASAFAGWAGPWEFADAAVTARRLEAAGLTNVTTDTEAETADFPDEAAFRAFIQSVILRDHVTRLTGAVKQRQFLDAVVARAAHYEPPYRLDYWRLNMQGQRQVEGLRSEAAL